MNILFMQNCRSEWDSGMSGSLLRLGNELKNMGHEVDYVFSDELVKITSRFRVKQIVFPYLIPKVLRKMQQKKKYDIVRISSGDGWVLGLYNKIFKAKRPYVQIMHSHGLEHPYYLEWAKEIEKGHSKISPQLRFWFNLIRLNEVKIAIKMADHVTCLSSEDSNYIVKTKWKSEKDVSVTGNGVIKSFFVNRFYQTQGTKLLFAATWMPMKGIFYLVKGFQKIIQTIPEATLSLLGTRMHPQEVLSYFPLETQDRIRVIPSVRYEEMVTEYTSHDIFIFPTLFEGFGNVILEAMATGIPIVATRTGAMCDLIENDINGIIIAKRDSNTLAEQTIRLIKNWRLREKIGRNAQKTARNHTWEKVGQKVARLYENLIESHKNQ